MDFGKQLKKLRAQRKLSVAETARRLGVSESTYRDWENGRAILGEPYPKLSEIFEVSLEELFGIEGTDGLESNAESEIDSIQRSLTRLRGLLK